MADRPWWHGAVLYQLYVRSWRDSNGDGYGDLRGIIERLDHLSWLGVDGIWLSPTMPSPDQDWGYDVSDYTGVHPELGTLEDLDALLAAAAERGIRVLLDLVPNHTSSAHPWFVDAVSARDAEHRDYYVWADPAPDGGPPNNWLDATGQPAWQWDAATSQYYLHNFLPGQPDLNWWLPSVHAEFREILRFWFDRGIAGFRIDVAHGLYKDADLRDNPVLPPGSSRLDGRFGQRPVYNANRPETHSVYRDWRKIAEGYSPAKLLVGETWVGDLGRLASYYGDGDELQLAFNFPFAFTDFNATRLADVVAQTMAALPADACPVWTGSNHDIGRFPTRWCAADERKARLALLVLSMLPGTVVLYYGDEIAMTDVDVPAGLQRDTMTLGGHNPQGNRDRARTPMQWDDSPSGGFTADGVRPWLPLPSSSLPATSRSVASQRDDHSSTLWLTRRLLALRRAELAGGASGLETLVSTKDQWVFQAGQLVVAANLSDRSVSLPAAAGEVLLVSSGPDWQDRGLGSAVLGPWEGVVARQPH
ncbi:MAG TPA: alpha-amylase family glycosyl hydrolase [Streptosporangiaceae bacterium]|nr:alpha-amylase family glycosyl hydrolase [Streptosporangiaceae bacterium]